MGRKQDGSPNGCSSNYHDDDNSVRSEYIIRALKHFSTVLIAVLANKTRQNLLFYSLVRQPVFFHGSGARWRASGLVHTSIYRELNVVLPLTTAAIQPVQLKYSQCTAADVQSM